MKIVEGKNLEFRKWLLANLTDFNLRDLEKECENRRLILEKAKVIYENNSSKFNLFSYFESGLNYATYEMAIKSKKKILKDLVKVEIEEIRKNGQLGFKF